MDGLTAYVIVYFGHLMNASERRARKHLICAQPLTEAEQRLRDGIAWEEAKGNAVPAQFNSLLLQRRSGLSDDPAILRLASGGLEAFFERTARRILAEDRDKVFLNSCPSCGTLARTPKARQCRFCGHDWHSNSATLI